MGGKATDVTDFIRIEVEKLIANALVAKGEHWDIDMNRNKVKSFIKQKIQHCPSSKLGGVVKGLRVVDNRAQYAVHIPNTHNSGETELEANRRSTQYAIEGGGNIGAMVGGMGEVGVDMSANVQASAKHQHTQNKIKKSHQQFKQGELNVGSKAKQEILNEAREFVKDIKIRVHRRARVVVHRLSEVVYGAKFGAVIGTVVGILGGPLILLGTAAGAALGAGIGAAVTELAYVTLTAEEIFNVNEYNYEKKGDFITIVLKHVYTAPVEEAIVRPH